MTALRVLVVDDEEFARQRVRRLLERERDVEVVGECATGRETVESIAALAPDLVFLDVQMPGLDGFGVLRELDAERAPLVIFVTAFDEHALRAFDVHALDYLLKPVDADRFHVALDRARRLHGQATAAERHAKLLGFLARMEDRPRDREATLAYRADPQANRADYAAGDVREAPRPPERLLIKEDGRMFFIKTAEIDWIESYGNYARVHIGARKHLIRDTMAELEKLLEPAGFARIHRSAIVNLDRVTVMQPWFSGKFVVQLADGTRLKLSRWYRDKLEKRIGR